MRRIGCLFLLVLGFALMGVSTAVWWLATALVGGARPPFHPTFLLLAAVFFMMLVGSFATRSFRRLAGPIGDVMVAIQRIEAGDYSTRVPEPRRSPGELRALVRSVNTMIARLELDESRRRALLADVSHELRTPLAVIQGEVEAIMDGIHPPDETHLGAMLDEVQVLSRLVDDLRTLVYSESGTLALHREPTDIGVLVTEVGDSFRVAAQKAGATLRIDVPDVIPLLDVDPVRIREVLSNLMVNALRYTPRDGTISIAGAVDGSSVVLTVSDTGAGIDPEQLPHVFERFAKGDGSRGSGLGLAIARHLVAAHGGMVTAESELGRGTTMRVRLPVEAKGEE